MVTGTNRFFLGGKIVIPLSALQYLPSFSDQSESVFRRFFVFFWLDVLFLFSFFAGGEKRSRCKKKGDNFALSAIEGLK
jgi:hypothetical protein